jgi:hypothetical protein
VTLGTRCFMLEKSGLVLRALRRYSSGGCPTPPKDHPGWPRACACGYAFTDDDPWQLFEQSLYRRLDTGELVTLRDAPPGALWHADWMLRGLDFSDPSGQPWHWWPGPDGLCLNVRLPDWSDWCIDSRSKNCTLPTDNVHRCWPRSGSPPDITVDKSLGSTCSAGAGSILSPTGWHGFLRDGELTP